MPARFEKPPKLWIRNRVNGLTTIAESIDVGPWNTNYPYWDHGARPQAESGIDGRRTNRAGIDLYLETPRRLGIAFGISNGKVSYGEAQVDWEFADEMPMPPAEDPDANIKQAPDTASDPVDTAAVGLLRGKLEPELLVGVITDGNGSGAPAFLTASLAYTPTDVDLKTP